MEIGVNGVSGVHVLGHADMAPNKGSANATILHPLTEGKIVQDQIYSIDYAISETAQVRHKLASIKR